MKRPFGEVHVTEWLSRNGLPAAYALLHVLPDGRQPPICTGIESEAIAEYMAAALNAAPEIPDPPKPPRETGFYRCLQRIKGRKVKGVKNPDREVWGIWYWQAGANNLPDGGYWRDPEIEGEDTPRLSDKDFVVIEERISESP